MQTQRSLTIVLLLLVSLLTVSAGAQEVSVRNKPYKGEMKGRGVDVSLEEMSKALGMPAVKTATGWTLGGTEVPTVEEAGVAYIKLSDLSAAGLKVTVNKEFNTIDVHRPVAKNDSNSASSSGLTLVYFGAPW